MSFINNLFGKIKTPQENSNKKIGGIIEYLGLEDFWLSCSENEQNDLTRYYMGGLSTGTTHSPIEGKISGSSNTVHKYFSGMLTWTTSEKNYTLSDKIIEYGLRYDYNKSGLIDYHFFLQNSADNYYKQREIRDDAFERVIFVCKKDLDLFPLYSKEMIKEYKTLPRITTFKTLIMTYENQGKYQDAIDVCNLAIKYELTDNTKGGYEGKLSRLKNKV